jgi:soluble lytic murein transglycosylase-like protein
VRSPEAARADRRGALLVAAGLLALSWDWSGAAPGGARSNVSAPARSRAARGEAELVPLRRTRERLTRRGRGLVDHEIDRLARAIVDEARAHGFPPELVLAVIEVESGFDPFAVSPVGALGLMQVLPSTGVELASRLGLPWHGPQTLFEPVANVRLGIAYLRELADRYGDVRVALAAYNWGPGRIDARLRAGVGVPELYPDLVLSTYRGDRAAAEDGSPGRES